MAYPPQWQQPTPRAPRRRGLIVAAVLVLGVVGAVVYSLTGGDSSPQQVAVTGTPAPISTAVELPTQLSSSPSFTAPAVTTSSRAPSTSSTTPRPSSTPASTTPTGSNPGSSTLPAGFAAGRQPVFEQCAVQGDGIKPSWSQGTLISAIEPKSAPAAQVSRSEAFWRPAGSSSPLSLRAGDRIFFRSTITPHLGKAVESTSDSNSNWSLISQMHGPLGTPDKPLWLNPEGELVVESGWWKYAAGVIDRQNNWEVRLAPYRDGQVVTFAFDIKLSTGTDGWVRVWMNGVKKMDVAKPVLQKDNWDGVELRTGVYSGDWNGLPIPMYRRWAQYTDISLNYVPGPHAIRLPDGEPSGECYGV